MKGNIKILFQEIQFRKSHCSVHCTNLSFRFRPRLKLGNMTKLILDLQNKLQPVSPLEDVPGSHFYVLGVLLVSEGRTR